MCIVAAAQVAGESGSATASTETSSETSTAADTPDVPASKPKPARKRTTKDWSKVKLDDIEKSWQKGDAEEELEQEYEHSQRVAKKMSGSGGLGGAKFDINNPESVKQAMKKDPLAFSGLGQNSAAASMVFVELVAKQMDGSEWDKESVDKLCSKWSALLKTAHLHANTFNIGETRAKKGDPRQVLVSVDKGWQAADIFKFVMMQPETVKITKDSKGASAQGVGRGVEAGVCAGWVCLQLISWGLWWLPQAALIILCLPAAPTAVISSHPAHHTYTHMHTPTRTYKQTTSRPSTDKRLPTGTTKTTSSLSYNGPLTARVDKMRGEQVAAGICTFAVC